MNPRRYPLQPLEARLHQTDHNLARTLNINHHTLQHLRTHGLTWQQADRYAIRAGYHPTELWPTYTQDAEQPPTPNCRNNPPQSGAA